MKKTCMYSFVMFNLLCMFFELEGSSGKGVNIHKKESELIYLESEAHALKRAALISNFGLFFAPNYIEGSRQECVFFNEIDYPGLKECQQAWNKDTVKKGDLQADSVSCVVASLLHEQEKKTSFCLKDKQDVVDTIPLTIVVTDLSPSTVSELSANSSSCGVTTFDSMIESDENEESLKVLIPEAFKKTQMSASEKDKRQRQRHNKNQKKQAIRLKEDADNALLEEACEYSEKMKHDLTVKQCGLSRISCLDNTVIKKNFTDKVAVVLPSEDKNLYELVLELLDQMIEDVSNEDLKSNHIDYNSDILAEIMFQSLSEYLQNNARVEQDVLLRLVSLNKKVIDCMNKVDKTSTASYCEYLKYVGSYGIQSLKIAKMSLV